MPRTAKSLGPPAQDLSQYKALVEQFIEACSLDVAMASSLLKNASNIERKRATWELKKEYCSFTGTPTTRTKVPTGWSLQDAVDTLNSASPRPLFLEIGSGHQRRFHPEHRMYLVSKAKELHSQGFTYSAIGRELGMSYMTASRMVKL